MIIITEKSLLNTQEEGVNVFVYSPYNLGEAFWREAKKLYFALIIKKYAKNQDFIWYLLFQLSKMKPFQK